MREIKFRGLNKPTKEWRYGYLVVDEKYCQIWQEGDVPCPVDPKTVGQYTGLKDKNGTEIYEGDVVHEHCSNPNVNWKYEVFYDGDEGKFWLKNEEEIYGQWNASDDPAYPRWDAYEVIGNIYQNPELLK